MTFIDAPANFYLGRSYDPDSDTVLDDDYVYYDSRDLTTHGLVLGMTGSGKTGLCVCLLEEAILDGVPAIIVDPKGDISNLLLTFPDLSASDFEPWVDSGEAERKQMDIPSFAADRAELWKNGLASWGIGSERIEKLRAAADYTIYTPGSDSGVPISILASLKAPAEFDAEVVREQINGTVTAILSLAGVNAQPVQDPEHVFMSNIIEHNWREGKDLTIEDIILQIQEPPFEKLGVLPIDSYYPADKRMQLVMALNSVIAAPSFGAWLQGVPMDIQQLLYTADGKPRVAILSLAHLNDTERMFIMTLVLESLVAWMRSQGGTTSLRALLYIDEIFGYFPPVKNPPSKEPLMRLLKQARAFGLGVLMATQNPVDLDYKGLSNIGTWFIGRLQSDGDRERIMSGLKEAASSEAMDLSEVKQMVAQIKSRVFLMRNVHEKGKVALFHSRWAINYLAGPLTRKQIEILMTDKRDALLAPSNTSSKNAPADTTNVGSTGAEAKATSDVPNGYKQSKPAASVDEFFLPVELRSDDAIREWEQENDQRADDLENVSLVYDAVLLGQAEVRYDHKKSGVRVDRNYSFHVPNLESSGFVNWDEYQATVVDARKLDTESRHEASYSELPTAFSDKSRLKELEDDLVDQIYRNYVLKIPYHEELDVYGDPDDDAGKFEAALHQAAREKRDAEFDKVSIAIEKKIDRLDDKLQKKQTELQKDKAKASSGNQDMFAAGVSGAIAIFQGKSASSAVSRIGRKFGRRGELKAELEATQQEIAQIEAEREELRTEFETASQEIQAKWDGAIEEAGEIEVTPYKKDVRLSAFGLGWIPYYAFMSDGRMEFAPAYKRDNNDV